MKKKELQSIDYIKERADENSQHHTQCQPQGHESVCLSLVHSIITIYRDDLILLNKPFQFQHAPVVQCRR